MYSMAGEIIRPQPTDDVLSRLEKDLKRIHDDKVMRLEILGFASLGNFETDPTDIRGDWMPGLPRDQLYYVYAPYTADGVSHPELVTIYLAPQGTRVDFTPEGYQLVISNGIKYSLPT